MIKIYFEKSYRKIRGLFFSSIKKCFYQAFFKSFFRTATSTKRPLNRSKWPTNYKTYSAGSSADNTRFRKQTKRNYSRRHVDSKAGKCLVLVISRAHVKFWQSEAATATIGLATYYEPYPVICSRRPRSLATRLRHHQALGLSIYGEGATSCAQPRRT